MTLYGIPNCDTVKKARAWLAEHGHAVAFHDYKKNGVDATWLNTVAAQTGWQALLNTHGTTWRKLDAATKAGVVDTASAVAVMLEHPSAIKRPLLEIDGRYHPGFTPQHYQLIFGE
jgi:arsenate reductase